MQAYNNRSCNLLLGRLFLFKTGECMATINKVAFEKIIQQIGALLLQELSASKNLALDVIANKQLLSSLINLIVPVMDELKILFPPYAAIFDLIEKIAPKL